MTDKAVQLPGEVRAVTWIALIVAGMVGLASSGEAVGVARPPSVEELQNLPSTDGDRRLIQTMALAQYEVVQGMRGPRATVLFLLSFICGLVMVSTLGLLFPGVLPREGRRQIAGVALLVAGALRTIDGAMGLVIAQRTAREVEKLLSSGGVPLPMGADPALVPPMMVATAVAMTLFTVGALVGAGQYLRSERAKQIVKTVDAATSRTPRA